MISVFESTYDVSNGLSSGMVCGLVDCVSAEVVHDLDNMSEYSLTVGYPCDGPYVGELLIRRILAAEVDDGTVQAFRIKRVSKPLFGVVEVYAEHISRDMMNCVIMRSPYDGYLQTVGGLCEKVIAMSSFLASGLVQNFSVDFASGKYDSSKPSTKMSWWDVSPFAFFADPGVSGSIQSLTDMQIRFDNATVKVRDSFSTDEKVLHVGRNVGDLTTTMDAGEDFNCVYPVYATGETDEGWYETLYKLPYPCYATLGDIGDEAPVVKSVDMSGYDSITDYATFLTAVRKLVWENTKERTEPTIELTPAEIQGADSTLACGDSVVVIGLDGAEMSSTVSSVTYDSLRGVVTSCTLGTPTNDMVSLFKERSRPVEQQKRRGVAKVTDFSMEVLSNSSYGPRFTNSGANDPKEKVATPGYGTVRVHVEWDGDVGSTMKLTPTFPSGYFGYTINAYDIVYTGVTGEQEPVEIPCSERGVYDATWVVKCGTSSNTISTFTCAMKIDGISQESCSACVITNNPLSGKYALGVRKAPGQRVADCDTSMTMPQYMLGRNATMYRKVGLLLYVGAIGYNGYMNCTKFKSSDNTVLKCIWSGGTASTIGNESSRGEMVDALAVFRVMKAGTAVITMEDRSTDYGYNRLTVVGIE